MSRLWAAPFTVQLVKADRPGELVHVLDDVTTRWRADGREDYPEAIHSSFDLEFGGGRGCRVVTWLKYFEVDGQRIFEKRYQGKFLFREASAEIELADGRHEMNPGGHPVVVKDGQASSPDPDVKITGPTISVLCYPVTFCGLSLAVDPAEPLVERMTHLPVSLFNVQVWSRAGRPAANAPHAPPEPTWDDLLDIHTDFKPLVVYLPANAAEHAYRIMPSRDEFTVVGGKVEWRDPASARAASSWFLPTGTGGLPAGCRLPSGAYVADGPTVWIPRATSKAVLRSKTMQPLHASLGKCLDHTCNSAGVPGESFDEQAYYHAFWEPRDHEFLAGIPGQKPEGGVPVPGDPFSFPHRVVVADNRNPIAPGARLLFAALESNVLDAGKPVRAQIRFRDIPRRETLGGGEVRGFLRIDADGPAQWLPVAVEKANDQGEFILTVPEGASGFGFLRLVVDRPGQGSPSSDIQTDFRIAVQKSGLAVGSVSVFTHYNRQAFLEGEGIELLAVVKNRSAVSGDLVLSLEEERSGWALEVARKKIDALAAGRHTFHLQVSPQATAILRPARYTLRPSLPGCEVYGRSVQIVSRTKPSPLVIAIQPSWEGSVTNAFSTEEGIDFLFENLQEMGINQIIETPGRIQHARVPIQEQPYGAASFGLPAVDFFYRPTLFQFLFDRALSHQTDMWLWKGRLVQNLRWGPLEDLDVDRGGIQFYMNLAARYPHLVGMDFGFWEAVEYIDMGSRVGSYPEQERTRENVFMPARYKEKYGLEFPTLTELKEYAETGTDAGGIYDRWRKFFEMRCGLIPETMGQYAEAARKIRPDLRTAMTEQEVMVAAPGAAMVPELAFRTLSMSRWQSTHENGTRPLVTALNTALGKYDDDAQVSTVYSMTHFHIPRIRRTHFRLWQRMLMALACGANEIGYQNTDAYIPVRRADTITPAGFATPSHVLERIALSSLNQAVTMYSGIFQHARRERDVAILHSETQLGFEHVYFGAEWHNNDILYRYVDTPFHRGAHLLRVESAFSGLLWSHWPADIIGEAAITSGRLAKYKGLVITGIEVHQLPEPVTVAIRKFIDSGGTVLMDRHCRPEIPGAARVDFGFDFIRTGWSNRNEYRGMQEEYDRVKERLDAALVGRLPRSADCDSPRVLLSGLKWGDSRFLVAAVDQIVKDTSFQGAYEREPVMTTITVTAAATPVVYDLFEMRRLPVEGSPGNRFRFAADLTRVGAKLYAIVPADVGQPDLRVSSAVLTGEMAAVEVRSVWTAGAAVNALLPIEITVHDPAGNVRFRGYRAVLGADPFREDFKIAVNDPAGEWRVVARELVSGRASTTTFAVASREPPPVPGRDVPDVAVYGAERIREFCRSAGDVVVPYDGLPGSREESREQNLSKDAASLAKGRLESLGLRVTMKGTGEFARVRRTLPPKTTNWSEKQVGPKYISQGNVVIADVGGAHSLLRSLVDVGALPVRVTEDFPGPGRGLLVHVVSPFYYGGDGLIVSGGDRTGLEKALAALGRPDALADILAPDVPRLDKAQSPMKSADPLDASDVWKFPRGIVPGQNGMPVMQIALSRDGSRILASTETFARNVFLLDDAGKILWAGKGAKKWPVGCQVTSENGAFVVDGSGGMYELDSQGRTVRRFPGIGSAATTAAGDVFLASTRDWTGAFRPDGGMVWIEDYFPQRTSYGALRGAQPHDDWVAVVPDGRYGAVLDWRTQGTDPEGRAVHVRRMRTVDMKSGRTIASYLFQPHESAADDTVATHNMSLHLSANGSILVVATVSGKLFVFGGDGGSLRGSHVQSGPILAAPMPKARGSPQGSPTAWQSRAPAQFIDIRPDGSRILAGFSNRRVVLLDSMAQPLSTLDFNGTVVSGAFLKTGFVVYAAGFLRGYDDNAKELWQQRMPVVYTMKAHPDGQTVICGSAGGYVYRVNAAGALSWTTDLHPASAGNVDDLFRELAAARSVYVGPPREYDTELGTLAAGVRLGHSILSPISVPSAWSGKGWTAETGSAGEENAVVIRSGGEATQEVTRDLTPFSTVFLVAQWKCGETGGGVLLDAEVRDESGETVRFERPATVTDPDWMDMVLPIKTGPKPVSLRVSVKAGARRDIRARRVGLHPAIFGGPNAALVPSAYTGMTKAARTDARARLNVVFRHLEGNLTEAVQVAFLEMVDGRIVRKGESRWTAGDVGQMGGVEIAFTEPKTIGAMAFYDDSAFPEAYMKQYLIEYWAVSEDAGEKRPERSEADKADEIDFTDVWHGQWRTAEVVRDTSGPAHVHRFHRPITSPRFRVSGVLNQGLLPRDEDTRITEVELYEDSWVTTGGSFQRSHYCRGGSLRGKLALETQRFLADRRATQAAPVFADGALYLAAGGAFHAVNLDSLKSRWTFKVNDQKAIRCTPTIAGGLVVFGSHDQNLRALYAKSGELAWSFPSDFIITGSPCVTDKTVCFGSGDGIVSALELNTGKLVWDFNAGQPVLSPVAGDGAMVFFGSLDRSVYALDAAKGERKWSFKTEGAVRAGVAVDAEAVYFGSDDASVYAVSKDAGGQIWACRTGGYVEASPAVDESTVYIGSLDGVFRALDRKTGKEVWRCDLKSPIRLAALVMGDDVLFCGDDSVLRRLRKRDGEKLDEIAIPGGRCLTELTPIGNGVMVGTRGGYFILSGRPGGK